MAFGLFEKIIKEASQREAQARDAPARVWRAATG
jgi:hypothetical protein